MHHTSKSLVCPRMCTWCSKENAYSSICKPFFRERKAFSGTHGLLQACHYLSLFKGNRFGYVISTVKWLSSHKISTQFWKRYSTVHILYSHLNFNDAYIIHRVFKMAWRASIQEFKGQWVVSKLLSYYQLERRITASINRPPCSLALNPIDTLLLQTEVRPWGAAGSVKEDEK